MKKNQQIIIIKKKKQDTIVHRFSKDCIHRLNIYPHVKYKIQKHHSERVSLTSTPVRWFKKQSQARMAEACGRKKTCRCIHKGPRDPAANQKKARIWIRVRLYRVSSRQSTSEASWVSTSKNIAVCSLFHRQLKFWTNELPSRTLSSSCDLRGHRRAVLPPKVWRLLQSCTIN